MLDEAPPSGGSKDDDTRAALFADLSKGEDVTKGMIHTTVSLTYLHCVSEISSCFVGLL